MRGGLTLPLGVSFGAHVVLAAVLVAPRLLPPAASADPPPQIAGETFELPAPEVAEVPLANASPSPDTVSSPDPAEGDAPARPTPPARGRVAARPSHSARPSGGREEPGPTDDTSGSSTIPALYGAVGERSASDLATAFTRAFPHAASADPVWRGAPLGSAGNAVVLVTLDETGHIESAQVVGSPGPALSSAIKSTLTLVKARPFVAKGKVTKLQLSATVSTNAVHDDSDREVFAIGGSFAGGEGDAFFALAIGRRIDVHVRAK